MLSIIFSLTSLAIGAAAVTSSASSVTAVPSPSSTSLPDPPIEACSLGRNGTVTEGHSCVLHDRTAPVGILTGVCMPARSYPANGNGTAAFECRHCPTEGIACWSAGGWCPEDPYASATSSSSSAEMTATVF